MHSRTLSTWTINYYRRGGGGLELSGHIVEMPWGGTWKSSIAAFLFLFLLLGVILTRNPLDASLASLSNLFCSHFKNNLLGHKPLHF